MSESNSDTSYRKPLLIALLVIVASLAVGGWYRTTDLGFRPMHNDEANQFGKLWDTYAEGKFEYDPHDHHGPTLIFSTIAARKIQGKSMYNNLSEEQLRMIPVIYGLLLILTLLLIVDGLGAAQVAVAAVILACSPSFIFFSRYYIMELPLVVFTSLFIGFGWRYYRSGKLPWALAAGVAAGLMHVTKETAAVAWLATGCWLFLAGVSWWRSRNAEGAFPFRPWHYVLAVAIGLLVSAALYSTFFRNPKAIVDSFATYFNYAERSEGAGHEKPWNYYLRVIAWYKDSVVWSELPVVLLGVVGMLVAVLKKQSLGKYLTVYTLASFAVYSAFAYKTPWTILPAYFGLVLLAGIGAVYLFRLIPSRAASIALAVLFAGGTLFWFHVQTSRASGEYSADPRNPYVYNHTSHDVVKLGQTIRALAAKHPEGGNMPIIVYKAPEGGWPLPWYLRGMPNITYVPKDYDGPISLNAPVIVFGIAEKDRFLLKLSKSHTEQFNFRPGEENDVVLLVDKALWESNQDSAQAP